MFIGVVKKPLSTIIQLYGTCRCHFGVILDYLEKTTDIDKYYHIKL